MEVNIIVIVVCRWFLFSAILLYVVEDNQEKLVDFVVLV